MTLETFVTQAELASPAPPNTTDVLSSTIQTLNDRIEALRASVDSAHTKLFGDYVVNLKGDEEKAPTSPGRLALLTRDLEGIIDIVQGALKIAESLDNQA